MTTSITHESFGPPIAASSTVEMEDLLDNYDAYGIARLRPVFEIYENSQKTLIPRSKIPDPSTVSPNDPDSIDLLFEIPGVEPDLSFGDYIRGVAVAGKMLDDSLHATIKSVLMMVAQRVIDGGGLPAIDVQFYDSFKSIETRIFGNGESVSWRPLSAFAQGMYWILSFVPDPHKKRGGFSPFGFVELTLTRSSDLGYIPQ